MFVSSLKVSGISDGYAGICDRKLLMVKWKLAIIIQIFAVSEVLCGSYCNYNANSGAETDAARSIFLW